MSIFKKETKCEESSVYFYPGQEVINIENGSTDTVVSVPGMPEYDSQRFIFSSQGFVLKNKPWSFQNNWKPKNDVNISDMIRSYVEFFVGKKPNKRLRSVFDIPFDHFDCEEEKPTGIFLEISELRKTLKSLEEYLGINFVKEEKKFEGYKPVAKKRGRKPKKK